MKYQNILLNKNGPVAIVTIIRPDKLNALNNLTLEELKEAFIDKRTKNRNQPVCVMLCFKGF
jgi:enoyl-CoA hydratase